MMKGCWSGMAIYPGGSYTSASARDLDSNVQSVGRVIPAGSIPAHSFEGESNGNSYDRPSSVS